MRIATMMRTMIDVVRGSAFRRQDAYVAVRQTRQAHASASIAARHWPRKLVVAAAVHSSRRLPGSAQHAACAHDYFHRFVVRSDSQTMRTPCSKQVNGMQLRHRGPGILILLPSTAW
jgi:hypothetical protein